MLQCNLENINTSVVHILLYADDMVIVAATKETLQMKIDVAAQFLRQRGLSINISKSKVMVFKRSGRISKFDSFTWSGQKIEVVKSYTYLGVLFNSSGNFSQAGAEFIMKGKMAQGAIFSSLKRTKIFNLGTLSKLFDSIIKSTTLYAAGVWGFTQADQLERVQQLFFKRAMNLPLSTPGYFVRLETGQPHIALDVMKLSLLMYQRILSSPPSSLLHESYLALRRVSDKHNIKKYSWCTQLKDALSVLGYGEVWNKNCADFLFVRRAEILGRLRQTLGDADVNRARVSKSIPHYLQISNGYAAEKYLTQNLPAYLVTGICQVRLNYSIVYNQGKWYNLSMFDSKTCKLCGEQESFAHLFECPQLADIKTRILPPYLPVSNYDDVLKFVHTNLNIAHCKSLYFFVTTALKRYFD